MNIKKIIDGLYFTVGMMLFNPATGEAKTPDELNEDDRATYDACMGAIALLKAQEPRLVTESNFNSADEYGYIPVWTEEKDGDMYWECIPKVAITDPDGIGVVRYWTSRPDQATREATPWN